MYFIYSCSSVTYAPGGSIPDPINLFGALVYFRQIMFGRFENPSFRKDEIILE